MLKTYKKTILKRLLTAFLYILIIFITAVPGISYGIKNPFIPPFKHKLIKRANKFGNLDLQGIIAGSRQMRNIAIINGKPYYKGSRVANGVIVKITADSVIIEKRNGKIIKLELKKYEGFTN